MIWLRKIQTATYEAHQPTNPFSGRALHVKRETMPRIPQINQDKCVGCELCFVTCRRGVYDPHDNREGNQFPFQCAQTKQR